MIISKFINQINKDFGLNLSASYYSHIEAWKVWYENYVGDFHTYSEMALDGARHKRTMYRLSMAKTVCEDWAALLLNDKTTVNTDHKTTREWLLGNAAGTSGILQQLDFWNQSNQLVELMMRSGTAAWVVSCEDMQVRNGHVLPSPNARIAVDYLPAECILPITRKHGKIVECAFASEVYYKGKACIYLQIHTIETGGYRIENYYYTSSSDTADDAAYERIDLPAGIAPVVHTGCPVPWFSIITPNAVNNVKNAPRNGLGASVYSNALDSLKMADIAYNNYVRDLRLGGKKLFYNKKLVRTYVDAEGVQHKIAPDDVQQQLFWTDGTSDPDQKAEVYDYNPSLRTNENHQAVQDSLDYLSMKCGLGGHFYVFEHDGISTATQYIGDKKTLVNNINRHQITVEAGLIQVVRAILWIGRHILGYTLIDPDTPISISWDASYITDEQAEREQMRKDVSMHILPAYKYISKYYEVSEDEARALTTEAEEDIPQLDVTRGIN